MQGWQTLLLWNEVTQTHNEELMNWFCSKTSPIESELFEGRVTEVEHLGAPGNILRAYSNNSTMLIDAWTHCMKSQTKLGSFLCLSLKCMQMPQTCLILHGKGSDPKVCAMALAIDGGASLDNIESCMASSSNFILSKSCVEFVIKESEMSVTACVAARSEFATNVSCNYLQCCKLNHVTRQESCGSLVVASPTAKSAPRPVNATLWMLMLVHYVCHRIAKASASPSQLSPPLKKAPWTSLNSHSSSSSSPWLLHLPL